MGLPPCEVCALAVALPNLVSASRFGTQMSGGDTVTRALRLNNSSPCGKTLTREIGTHGCAM